MATNFHLTSAQHEALAEMKEALTCAVCNKCFTQDVVSTDCPHHFCRTCLEEALRKNGVCPVCLLPQLPGRIKTNHMMTNIANNYWTMTQALQREMEEEGAKRLKTYPGHVSSSFDSPIAPTQLVETQRVLSQSDRSSNESSPGQKQQQQQQVKVAPTDITSTLVTMDSPSDDIIQSSETITATQDNVAPPTPVFLPPTQDIGAVTTGDTVDSLSLPSPSHGGGQFPNTPPPNTQQLDALVATERLKLAHHQRNIGELDRLIHANKTTPAPATITKPIMNDDDLSSTKSSHKRSMLNRKPMVILGSALTAPKQLLLQTLVKELSKPYRATLVDQPTPEVTHVIVHCEKKDGFYVCRPTYKYFWAVSRGLWVLRHDYLDQCKLKKEWLEGELWEVASMPPGEDNKPISAHYRLTRQFGEPALFHGRTFFLGPFPRDPNRVGCLNREQCLELLALNDAHVVNLNLNEGDHVDVKQLVLPMMKRGSSSARAAAAATSQIVVIVGHPNDLDHAGKECWYCAHLVEDVGIYDVNDETSIAVVESAWLMRCLSERYVFDFAGRILNVVEHDDGGEDDV